MAGITKKDITFLEIDTPNQNGRIYKRSAVEKALKDYQVAIQSQTAMGCFWDDLTGTGPNIPLDKVSHTIIRAEIVGNYVVGDAYILSTPKGQVLQAIMNDPSVQFGVRGYGIVAPNGVVSEFVINSVNVFIETSFDKKKQKTMTDNFNYDRAMGIVGKRK